MKRNLTFYEQVGILIPGGVLLFGLFFYVPELQAMFAKEGIGLGSLGIFLIVAYAVGHALAGFGNLIDNAYWHFRGGLPSNWVIGSKPRLLSTAQIATVHERIRQRLGLTLPPLSDLDAHTWYPVTRQIYSDVQRFGRPDRVDTFNGNYGLNRGLSMATLALAIVTLIAKPEQWYVSLGLLLLSVVYLYHMSRFGQHYARELFVQFLLLPTDPGKPKKNKRA